MFPRCRVNQSLVMPASPEPHSRYMGAHSVCHHPRRVRIGAVHRCSGLGIDNDRRAPFVTVPIQFIGTMHVDCMCCVKSPASLRKLISRDTLSLGISRMSKMWRRKHILVK